MDHIGGVADCVTYRVRPSCHELLFALFALAALWILRTVLSCQVRRPVGLRMPSAVSSRAMAPNDRGWGGWAALVFATDAVDNRGRGEPGAADVLTLRLGDGHCLPSPRADQLDSSSANTAMV